MNCLPECKVALLPTSVFGFVRIDILMIEMDENNINVVEDLNYVGIYKNKQVFRKEY